LRRRVVRSTNTPQFRGFGAENRFVRFPEIDPMRSSRMRFDAAPVVE
jgi:hypothetical protein